MAEYISGVLCYVKVIEPVKKYQSEDKEFSLDIVVDKATAKEWSKRFPKQKAKIIDREDFEGIFKIPPPFDGDQLYVVKLKKPAQYKDGQPLPKKYWPKVLVNSKEGAVDLDDGVLVANGSKGKVSFDVTTNDFGTFARLRNILIEELIEYRKAGSDPAADFGLKSANAVDDFDVEEQDTPKKSKNNSTLDDEDDMPF